MKILFLLLNYSPFGGAASKIVLELIEEFYARGIEIDVLTNKYELDQTIEQKQKFGSIYRIENYTALNLKKQSCGFFKKCVIAFEKFKDKLFLKNKKNFQSPLIIKNFYNGLKRLNIDKYDYIIPVCSEFAVYGALEKYRKKFGLKNRIVIYQLDPLSTNNVFSSQSFSARLSMERKMAKETAVVTTEIVKKQKESKNIDCANVITLEFPSIKKILQKEKPPTAEISVVFSGFLYRDVRNPEYALKLFSRIKNPNVKLYIVGGGLENLTCQYAEASEGKIIPLGVLPLEQAEQKILEADFLLNIGNKDINFVPSKIFDYISTGKPIINTFKDPACPTLKYFTKYDNVLCIDENAPIENELIRLEEFIKTNYNKVLSYEEITKNFKENTVEFVAEKFIKVLIENIDKTNGDKNGTV